MKAIIEMTREELLAIQPKEIDRILTPEEVVYMATVIGAFWSYDYNAAKSGRVGMHALLKSGLHSDGFFVSRIFLQPWNILFIMANQIVLRLHNAGVPEPNYVAGIPEGATELGATVKWMLFSKLAPMQKVDGRISLFGTLPPGESLLLIEDFCTRGTGFTEAVISILENNPKTRILPYDPVIINRGGLQEVVVEGVGSFKVLPVVERRIQDWNPTTVKCPLCELGSTAIKPKATEYNWQQLLDSQKG